MGKDVRNSRISFFAINPCKSFKHLGGYKPEQSIRGEKRAEMI